MLEIEQEDMQAIYAALENLHGFQICQDLQTQYRNLTTLKLKPSKLTNQAKKAMDIAYNCMIQKTEEDDDQAEQ
jgi:hypothetical protein